MANSASNSTIPRAVQVASTAVVIVLVRSRPASLNTASAGPERYIENRYNEARAALGATKAPNRGLFRDSLVRLQQAAFIAAKVPRPIAKSAQGAADICTNHCAIGLYSGGRADTSEAQSTQTNRTSSPAPAAAAADRTISTAYPARRDAKEPVDEEEADENRGRDACRHSRYQHGAQHQPNRIQAVVESQRRWSRPASGIDPQR